MQAIHFIAGLPRSGSTLLSAILRQNPKIHASITSPMASLVDRLHQTMSARSDYSDMLTPVKRGNLLAGLFSSYHADTGRDIVFDTNRHWCSRMGLINHLFPKAKVVACVRDPIWILDSLERLFQASPLMASKMFTPEQAQTCHTRIEALTASGGVVGFAYDAFNEAYHGPWKGQLVVIEYDQLCQRPAEVIDFLYDALGLLSPEKFPHDFEHLDQIEGAPQYDHRFGAKGLHWIRNKVEWAERESILPPDVIKRYSNRTFWRK